MTKAVFLDKDGTLVEDIPYNVDARRMRLSHGAIASLRRLQRAGYALLVVSNQPGVALGRFDVSALQRMTRRLCATLRARGVNLAGVYYCPHHPEANCGCRKPAPGLLQRAAVEHDIELCASWMIGDILNDIEAGQRAGCRTVLIDNGNETEWQDGRYRRPHARVNDLLQAAEFVLASDGHNQAVNYA